MAYKDKEDQRTYAKQHYLDNKELYKQRARISTKGNIQRNRDLVNNLKGVPCLDCENQFPSECMDFDHISEDKDKNVSRLVNNGASIKRILAEIDKCEIICSNCHRIRTKQRLA